MDGCMKDMRRSRLLKELMGQSAFSKITGENSSTKKRCNQTQFFFWQQIMHSDLCTLSNCKSQSGQTLAVCHRVYRLGKKGSFKKMPEAIDSAKLSALMQIHDKPI